MNTKQIYSSILGFIIGDVLGVPFEFVERAVRRKHPVTTMVGGGTWKQPIGTWSDDTSMVLCTIDSLTRGYNIADLGLQFYNWVYKKKFTPYGIVFDCGDQTRASLKEIYKSVQSNQPVTPLPPTENEKLNGNGSLMRILPLGFYLQNHDIREKWKIIQEVSSLTHPHIRSVIGCFIYTELVLDLIETNNKWDSYQRMKGRVSGFLADKVPQSELKAYENILSSDISLFEESSIRSSPAYVVYTLESVLWCFLRGNSYRESVLTSINLGGDTDTIGALVGGLSGLVYGMEGIPDEWVNSIVKREEIIDQINRFVESLK
jgi:ADP-ribosylglycohydrolase